MSAKARNQAIKDIRAELENEHKEFIEFYQELNPVMSKLVKDHVKMQNLEKMRKTGHLKRVVTKIIEENERAEF